jgi:hypothetical protein
MKIKTTSMESRLRAAKPQFTPEQLAASERMAPEHLYQAPGISMVWDDVWQRWLYVRPGGATTRQA